MVYEKSAKKAFLFWNACKITSAWKWPKKFFWPLQICSRLAKKIFMFIRQNAEKIWDGLGGIRTENPPPHFSLNSLCFRNFVKRSCRKNFEVGQLQKKFFFEHFDIIYLSQKFWLTWLDYFKIYLKKSNACTNLGNWNNYSQMSILA